MTRTSRSLFGRLGAASWLVAGMLALGAVEAAAQTADTPSAVFVGVGGGVGHSFHGDLNFYAPAWEAEIGFRRSTTFAIELGFGQWRRTEKEEFLDVTLGPSNGVVGHVDRIEQRTVRLTSAFEVNMMAGGSVGRVRLSGGGGAGFMTMSRTFERTFIGCSLSIPAACEPGDSRFSSIGATVQGVGRVEVPVTDRVSAYGAARLWVHLRDVGASGVRMTGGVRVSF